jgi:hypothetical protein
MGLSSAKMNNSHTGPRSILILVILLIGSQLSAQEGSTYEMEFVRAGWLNDRSGQKQIVVVFNIIPLIDDFQLIVSMRLGYELHGRNEVVDIQGVNNIRFAVFGNDVSSKKPILYQFIKDHVDLDKENIYLLQMIFTNMGEEPIHALHPLPQDHRRLRRKVRSFPARATGRYIVINGQLSYMEILRDLQGQKLSN